MVPIMLLFLDMKLVVAVSASFTMLCGYLLFFTFQTKKWVRKDIILMLIIGGLIGTIVGTYMLASYKSDILKKVLGIFIMAYALKMLFWNKKTDRKLKSYIGIIAGFFGGILGGLFSTGGPPVVVYLDNIINDKKVFRATIIFYFLVVNTWQFALYCYKGLINMDTIKFTLYLMPAFIMGNLIGSFLHIKINDVFFNRIIAIVLLVTGASNLF
jgi:uncharacterized membrane protein YfcA